MSISCECLEKLSPCFPCKLNVIAYIAGWLGIIFRVVFVGLISTTISSLTNDDPSIYSIFFGTLLAYLLASLLVNVTFLYGIFIEKRHYILPYITIMSFELCVIVMVTSGMCMLLFAIGAVTAGLYVLNSTEALT
ncbi:unnamed protein product [Ceutorhynchus assimilis]|uniref:Uncharacterized protein n=1 Tax=Ceutorhynchus assimilis TaxID=467358 RepID=A0A9N9MKK6_9CUCU|nr:unnamed protein product [Ceutorhynchus assimilis]